MDLIKFSIACRTCGQTDGLRWSYEWDDEDGQLSIKNRTDFGVMQVVELMTRGQEHVCPFCDSPNLEFFDMEVNGERLFDFGQTYQRYGPQGMTIFSVNVIKAANSQLEVQLSTLPTTVEEGFLPMALDHMTLLVGKRPAYDFAAGTTGTFYCCVSGRWDADARNQIIYPQKYTCRGLTREEVLFVIQSVRRNVEG